jgi:hypothetical protein
MTAEAWGVTTNYQASPVVWNAGMTVDGNVIANILSATGVNADWIRTGTFSISKTIGSITTEIFYANVDTGVLRINADSLTLKTGESLSAVASTASTAYTTANSAQTTASNAATAASNAAKTATNYLSWTNSTGLVVSQDATRTGFNVQILGDGIYLNNASTTLAKLQSGELTFYKPGTSTVAAKYTSDGFYVQSGKIGSGITLDGSTGKITLDSSDIWGALPYTTQIDRYGNANFFQLKTWVLTIGELLSEPSDLPASHIDVTGYISVSNYVEAYRFISNGLRLKNLSSYSNLTQLGVDSTGEVYKVSSSSIRYKDVDRQLEPRDVEKLFSLPVYSAKYKDGYLAEHDPMNGKYMPMLVAEDLESLLPEAVIRDEKGQAEDWNYRVLIPVMIEMIKSLKEEVKKRGD